MNLKDTILCLVICVHTRAFCVTMLSRADATWRDKTSTSYRLLRLWRSCVRRRWSFGDGVSLEPSWRRRCNTHTHTGELSCRFQEEPEREHFLSNLSTSSPVSSALFHWAEHITYWLSYWHVCMYKYCAYLRTYEKRERERWNEDQ